MKSSQISETTTSSNTNHPIPPKTHLIQKNLNYPNETSLSTKTSPSLITKAKDDEPTCQVSILDIVSDIRYSESSESPSLLKLTRQYEKECIDDEHSVANSIAVLTIINAASDTTKNQQYTLNKCIEDQNNIIWEIFIRDRIAYSFVLDIRKYYKDNKAGRRYIGRY